MRLSDLFTKKRPSYNLSIRDAVQSKLAKAEALAIIATLTDFSATDPKTLENYLWALSEMIQEAKSLYYLSLSS